MTVALDRVPRSDGKHVLLPIADARKIATFLRHHHEILQSCGVKKDMARLQFAAYMLEQSGSEWMNGIQADIDKRAKG